MLKYRLIRSPFPRDELAYYVEDEFITRLDFLLRYNLVRQKNDGSMNYELTNRIFHKIDWKKIHQRKLHHSERLLKEINFPWKNDFLFNKNNEMKYSSQDHADEIIMGDLYQLLMYFLATDLHIEYANKSKIEKLKDFDTEIEDYNKNIDYRISDIFSDLSQQIRIIKLRFDLEEKPMEQVIKELHFIDHGKKFDKKKTKDSNLKAYEEVFIRNDKTVDSYVKITFKSICYNVAEIMLSEFQDIEKERFYNRCGKFKRKHNIKNHKDFLKKFPIKR